jgi:hypothetical protein
MKYTSHVILYLPLILIALLAILMVKQGLYATTTSLQENDYVINDFGIRNGSLFITVEGIAGGSYDPSMGDEGYSAYLFDTDKGKFQVTIGEGIYNNGTPYHLTDEVVVNEIKLNECLFTKEASGHPNLYNNTVEYVDKSTNINKVDNVYAIQVRIDDPDGNCETGEHVDKIFSNQTNASLSSISSTVE